MEWDWRGGGCFQNELADESRARVRKRPSLSQNLKPEARKQPFFIIYSSWKYQNHILIQTLIFIRFDYAGFFQIVFDKQINSI